MMVMSTPTTVIMPRTEHVKESVEGRTYHDADDPHDHLLLGFPPTHLRDQGPRIRGESPELVHPRPVVLDDFSIPLQLIRDDWESKGKEKEK